MFHCSLQKAASLRVQTHRESLIKHAEFHALRQRCVGQHGTCFCFVTVADKPVQEVYKKAGFKVCSLMNY
ncbi:hypothetical protein LguiA_021421 [Lonicera macranthoides]